MDVPIYIFDHFMKNPQTTIAPTFLTHIISAIDGVGHLAATTFSLLLLLAIA